MRVRFLKSAGLAMFLLGGACLSVHAAAINDPRSMGFGTVIGQPIGITGKYWVNNLYAVDAVAGYHFNHNFDMHADYLVNAYVLSASAHASLPIYVGLGARILAGDDTQFGLRIPFGISYLLSAQKIELFAEVAPVVDLSNIGVDIDGLVGVRVYTF